MNQTQIMLHHKRQKKENWRSNLQMVQDSAQHTHKIHQTKNPLPHRKAIYQLSFTSKILTTKNKKVWHHYSHKSDMDGEERERSVHWLGSEGTSLISVILDRSKTPLHSESEPSDSSSSSPVSIFKVKNSYQKNHARKCQTTLSRILCVTFRQDQQSWAYHMIW